MKTFIFDKKDYGNFTDFFVSVANSIESEKEVNLNVEHYSSYPISVLLFYRKERNIKLVFKNFDVLYNRHNRNRDNLYYLDLIDFMEYYSKKSPEVQVEIIEDNPTPIVEKPIEKEVIFNRKEYVSYKDFYKDICYKMNASDDLNCLFPNDLGYSGDNLNEFLWDYYQDNIKYIFIGFDKEKIKLQKTYDDYKYNIILEVFEDFVKLYPNNKLEFRNDNK